MAYVNHFSALGSGSCVMCSDEDCIGRLHRHIKAGEIRAGESTLELDLSAMVIFSITAIGKLPKAMEICCVCGASDP